MTVNVAISTVNRRRPYIHRLIARLRKDLPLRLVVGAPDYDYLKRYSRRESIQVIGIDPPDWEKVKRDHVIQRALWNYWRCLTYGGHNGQRGLVVLEDDVLPAVGWEERFYQTIERIELEYGDEYILAMFTYFKELAKPVDGGYYNFFPSSSFGGTPAMYYPERIRIAFAEYLRDEGIERFRMAYDWLLREYLRLTGVPCFATSPCLFQHVGTVSTGLSASYVAAGCFRKKL